MQVILREDVPHLGRQGDVVKVTDGFARNYLLPQRLAYRFTDGIRKQVDTEARAKVKRDVRERDEAAVTRARLEEIQVVRFRRRSGPNGALYGSVTNADISDALVALGFEITKRQVNLAVPIKQLGTHRVKLHIYKETDVELAVEVEPEDEAAS